MSANKESKIGIVFRIFLFYATLLFVFSIFWNVLVRAVGGSAYFPFAVVCTVATILTMITVVFQSIFVTIFAEIFLGKNESYKQWKASGGRPYWDKIGWPANLRDDPDSSQTDQQDSREIN